MRIRPAKLIEVLERLGFSRAVITRALKGLKQGGTRPGDQSGSQGRGSGVNFPAK